MRAPILGEPVHYVAPDLTCHAAIVTKVNSEIGVNVMVFRDGAGDNLLPPVRPGMINAGPKVAPPAMFHVAGVSAAQDIPPYVPYNLADEQKTWDEAETKRVEAEVKAATTAAEKAGQPVDPAIAAVQPAKPFVPPAPEVLAANEEQRVARYEYDWDAAHVGTWHSADAHTEIDLEGQKAARAIAAAQREVDKAQAKHAAVVAQAPERKIAQDGSMEIKS